MSIVWVCMVFVEKVSDADAQMGDHARPEVSSGSTSATLEKGEGVRAPSLVTAAAREPHGGVAFNSRGLKSYSSNSKTGLARGAASACCSPITMSMRLPNSCCSCARFTSSGVVLTEAVDARTISRTFSGSVSL